MRWRMVGEVDGRVDGVVAVFEVEVERGSMMVLRRGLRGFEG